MMSEITPEKIREALRSVKAPGGGQDIVSAGLVSGVSVKDGKVGFLVAVEKEDTALQKACEQAVLRVAGVESVTVVQAGEASTTAAPLRRAVWHTEPIPGVSRILAVASGKGGVGKSTTSVNLAHAFARRGLRVGLLDADIYGPSLPRMMGLSGKPETEGGVITPLLAHGIKCMSMGLLLPEDSAIVWRGPQVTKALAQMLRGVAWGPLDVLLIDMPPGTGDTHLSLVQQVPVNGAVIVTTPQDVAVADARKCLDMFRKVNVPVLGVIENMSGFTDPGGTLHAIFGEGGGRRLAQEQGVPYLGEVPIDLALRVASDSGAQYPDAAGIYKAIAGQLT